MDSNDNKIDLKLKNTNIERISACTTSATVTNKAISKFNKTNKYVNIFIFM